jgi:hypothetical protein
VPTTRDGDYGATWDYVGVVYDRCQNWVVRAVRRFVVKRSVTVTGSGPYTITDKEGSPKLDDHVGPVTQEEAAARSGDEQNPIGRPRAPDAIAPEYEKGE